MDRRGMEQQAGRPPSSRTDKKRASRSRTKRGRPAAQSGGRERLKMDLYPAQARALENLSKKIKERGGDVSRTGIVRVMIEALANASEAPPMDCTEDDLRRWLVAIVARGTSGTADKPSAYNAPATVDRPLGSDVDDAEVVRKSDMRWLARVLSAVTAGPLSESEDSPDEPGSGASLAHRSKLDYRGLGHLKAALLDEPGSLSVTDLGELARWLREHRPAALSDRQREAILQVSRDAERHTRWRALRIYWTLRKRKLTAKGIAKEARLSRGESEWFEFPTGSEFPEPSRPEKVDVRLRGLLERLDAAENSAERE